MFSCEKCGSCCRNLDKSDLYADLNSGNGVCKYLVGNLCSIYDTRPLLCRVDDCYEIFFKDIMTKAEYINNNKKYCKLLKRNLEE